MKSVFIFYLFAILSSSLVSCQGSKTTEESSQVPESTEVQVAPQGIIHRVGVADFKAAMGEGMQLVDVRTPEEFTAGHIENALNYNINGPDFKDQVASLDKTKPVLVYCKMGGRSARAAKVLEELGFTTIYDLEGGYTDWVK